MLVLMANGIKGEVTASIYSEPMNDGTKRYVVRTHAGTMFTVAAKSCRVIEDASFEPFKSATTSTTGTW
jgi:hypothetical protein